MNEPVDYISVTNQEDVSRILVVVCGTNDYPTDDTAWEWKGVYEWDSQKKTSPHSPTKKSSCSSKRRPFISSTAKETRIW